jgi:thymidylate synthase
MTEIEEKLLKQQISDIADSIKKIERVLMGTIGGEYGMAQIQKWHHDLLLGTNGNGKTDGLKKDIEQLKETDKKRTAWAAGWACAAGFFGGVAAFFIQLIWARK